VCWSSTKPTSSSSHLKFTCSRHDIGEKLLNWHLTTIIHSFIHSFIHWNPCIPSISTSTESDENKYIRHWFTIRLIFLLTIGINLFEIFNTNLNTYVILPEKTITSEHTALKRYKKIIKLSNRKVLGCFY
jgi:hypothetical protein